jgi:hypothetical protein
MLIASYRMSLYNEEKCHIIFCSMQLRFPNNQWSFWLYDLNWVWIKWQNIFNDTWELSSPPPAPWIGHGPLGGSRSCLRNHELRGFKTQLMHRADNRKLLHEETIWRSYSNYIKQCFRYSWCTSEHFIIFSTRQKKKCTFVNITNIKQLL